VAVKITNPSYRRIVAADLFLDATTKNLFLRDQFVNVVSLGETQSFLVEKQLLDVVSPQELYAAELAKPFSDGFSVAQDVATTQFGKNNYETVPISEETSFEVLKTLRDEPVIEELFSIGYVFSPFTESVSVAQDVATTQFGKNNYENVPLSEIATLFLAKNIEDIPLIGEELSIFYGLNTSETITTIETFNRVVNFNRGLSDTPIVSEAFNIAKPSLASSVFNAGAFNTAPLNN